MSEHIKYFVGLDVHKDKIAVAVAEAEGAPARYVGNLGHDLKAVLKVLAKYGAPAQVQVVYEAGPTGFGLYRSLCECGYPAQVIAPSLIPRRAGERIKNDRRDCLRLAELARAGELTAIWVPDAEHEALRNLWRAREDALAMRQQGRQQLKAFLLRSDRRYAGKTSWNAAHLGWIAEQKFAAAADQTVLGEYQLALATAEQRVQRVTQALTHAIEGWRFEPTVAALRSLRGIDLVSAIGLVAEIGDFRRFATPRQLMGYLGLVPSEHSTGDSVRRGSITKTGNGHARRLLTEAAWNYRFPARMSTTLRQRNQAQPERIQQHAWKAQQRLCGRFARLNRRGVQRNKVCVAVARELAGFVWAVAGMAPVPAMA